MPALPGELLLHGQYDKSLRVMAGHNADEVRIAHNPSNTRYIVDPL